MGDRTNDRERAREREKQERGGWKEATERQREVLAVWRRSTSSSSTLSSWQRVITTRVTRNPRYATNSHIRPSHLLQFLFYRTDVCAMNRKSYVRLLRIWVRFLIFNKSKEHPLSLQSLRLSFILLIMPDGW